jgi:transcriptional regulator with XRE-family HTH domain
MSKNISPGIKIRHSRISRGLTQHQLTNLVNQLLPPQDIIERSLVSRWEKDLHFPRQARKKALEDILGIKLGNPSPKANSIASYIKFQDAIQDRLLYNMQGCHELWITSANSRSGVWQGMANISKTFEKLRANNSCSVKELFYLQTLDDVKKLKALAEAGYPNYRLSARIAPGQPLPIIHIPDKKVGFLLSGFGDDVRNAGLQLEGDIASFAEHTFRYRWVYSVVIADNQFVYHDKIKYLNNQLKSIGGSTDKLINIR